MPLPRNAHYVPGSARTMVITGDGRTITRQAAMNEFAQSAGAKNDYALRQASRTAGNITDSPAYKRDLAMAARNGLSAPEFKARAQLLASAPRDSRGKVTDHDALDRYLKAIGRRDDSTPWAAGETPSVYA